MTILQILIAALIIVESDGNPNAVGDKGQAIGILQIHPICVQDVNRILGEEKYTLIDRLDPIKSVEICIVYLNYYGKDKSVEQLARIWNGGPKGFKRKSTLPYWDKVKKVIEEIKKIK